MSTGLCEPWRAGLEPDFVWPEWLLLWTGSYHHKPSRASMKPQELSGPSIPGRGRTCLSLTRGQKNWRDPHPAKGAAAPPLKQTDPLSAVCLCPLLCCLLSAPLYLALLFFLAVSFLTPFLTPTLPAPSHPTPNSLCKAAGVPYPTPPTAPSPSVQKPRARGLPGDPV